MTSSFPSSPEDQSAPPPPPPPFAMNPPADEPQQPADDRTKRGPAAFAPVSNNPFDPFGPHGNPQEQTAYSGPGPEQPEKTRHPLANRNPQPTAYKDPLSEAATTSQMTAQPQQAPEQNQMPQENQQAAESKPLPPQVEKIQNFMAKLDEKPLPPILTRTSVFLIVCISILLFGLTFGAIFFSSKPTPTLFADAVRGVVRNPDIRQAVPRCGTVAKGQACVVYLMNPDSADREAKTFFQLVADMTGIYKYVIETANPNYANTIIRPGHIGAFYIMPTR